MAFHVQQNEDIRGHVERVRREGYTILPQAIEASHLADIQAAFGHAFDSPDGPGGPGFGGQLSAPPLETYAAAMATIDHPTILSVVASLIGRDTTLCQAPSFFRKLPGTESHIGWHNDFRWMVDVPYPRQNAWVQVNVLLNNVADDQGPMKVMPGKHLSDGPCPTDLPVEDERGVPFTGRAGDVMINNMEIWHCNGHNRSEKPREMFVLGYKHAWMRTWNDERPASAEVAEALEGPVKRQLCGIGAWNRTNEDWAIEVEGASLW